MMELGERYDGPFEVDQIPLVANNRHSWKGNNGMIFSSTINVYN